EPSPRLREAPAPDELAECSELARVHTGSLSSRGVRVAIAMRVWDDLTNSPHVLVFRPLIRLLRERGHEVEVTAREFAQTMQLLELHGIEATSVCRHGGASTLGKARAEISRVPALRKWARP